MRDERPDELLEGYGRVAWRLGLALAWSDGLEGEDAKCCSRTGSASWKCGERLPADEEAAVAFFKTRARKRNPVVVASRSNLVLVEFDGDLVELCANNGLRDLPGTVQVQSRRGLHSYYRPPAGRPPLKVQVDANGVTVSDDGYLVGAGALHPTGIVYEYVSNGAVAELPVEACDLLRELHEQADAELSEKIARGDPVDEGARHVVIFRAALEALREGLDAEQALERALQANAERCDPPYPDTLVRKHWRGAVKFAAAHPSETEKARTEARRILRERRDGTASHPAPRKKSTALWLPFADVTLSGPIRWVWRDKAPERAVTLLASRPKLGKSLLSIWIAAQLSRGLLAGAYYGHPAKTLLIAAEDPVDPIVKGRLIAAGADELLVGTLASRPTNTPGVNLGGLGGLEHADDSENRMVKRNLDQGRQGRQGRQISRGGLERDLGGLDSLGAVARRITIPDEYGLLEQIVVENEIALVVLDPINSFLSSKIDSHKDTEIRRVLDPLGALAARHGFAALAIVHLNRRTDSDVLNRITGSGGYGGSARSILTFGRDPEDDARRIVAAEGNWQRDNRSEVFELLEVIVFPDADPDEQTQPALVHVGTSALDSSDLVDQLTDDRAALDQAKDYLLAELALGPVPVADLRRGAEAHGISWRTVERAKKLLGAEARRLSSLSAPRGSGRWEWFLELVEERTDEPEE